MSSTEIVFKQNRTPVDSNFDDPILASLSSILTEMGDIVKLDAMVLINILTSGNGLPASHDAVLAIERITTIPGSAHSTLTIVIAADVLDTNLNNPATTTPFTRLSNLTWVDTPPPGITNYIFRVTSATSFNIASVAYTDRFFSALVFHNN